MSKVKRYFLILPILCIALIPCTSIFASAVNDLNTRVVDVGCPEPYVSENAGYVVLQPRYDQVPNVEQKPFVISWIIYPKDGVSSVPVELTLNDDSVEIALTRAIDCMMQISVYSQAGSNTQYYFAYSDSPARHTIDFYDVIPLDLTVPFMSVSGNIGELIDNRTRTSSLSLSLLWSDTSEQYHLLVDQTQTLLLMYSSFETSLEYDLLFLNLLESIYSSVSSSDITLTEVNATLIETYSLLSEYLKAIEKDTTGLVGLLNQLYDEWYNWTWVEEEYYLRIIELLEQLIEGTEEFTESSSLSPEQDELNRVEDELLNNEEASNAQDDIKVEVNQDAMSVIWDLISDFFQTNPKIMGMVITILSLGIIALILNR